MRSATGKGTVEELEDNFFSMDWFTAFFVNQRYNFKIIAESKRVTSIKFLLHFSKIQYSARIDY